MSSILLIQSNPAWARELHDALGADARYSLRGNVTTLAEARRSIGERAADLLICDLRLPDGAFRDLMRELRPSRSHVLVTTSSLHDPHLMHALRSGADGFLLAGRSRDETLNTIRQTLAGGASIAPEVARQLLMLFDQLNARPIPFNGLAAAAPDAADRQLLRWTSEGYRPDEIARGLGIATADVGRRVRALYRKVQFERPAARALRRAA